MPNPIETLFAKAFAAHRVQRLSEAEYFYQQILRHDPHALPALQGLARLAAHQAKWSVAIAWLNKALAIAPQSAELHYHLAGCLRKNQQNARAQSHYEQALAADPHNPEIYNSYAVLLLAQKETQRAKQLLHTALTYNNHYPEAHFNLGLAYLAEHDLEQAEHAFLSALVIDPQFIPAHWQCAALYWKTETYSKIHSHYQQLLQLDPDSVALYNNYGVLWLHENQLDKAAHCFQQALERDPKNSEARNNLAALSLKSGQFKEAIWHYSLLLNLIPMDQDALYHRAYALMLSGQLAAAREDLQTILKANPAHRDARCNLAAIYLKLEDRDSAQQHYQILLEAEPDHPIARYLFDALNQKTAPHQAPLEYIQHLFDGYAGHFDHHLQTVLRYQLPEQLYAQLKPYLTRKDYTILDLGCGTGLSGLPFRSIAKTLIGVDASAAMLTQARLKKCYDQLIQQDIGQALNSLGLFDIILCVDTFVYFGPLQPLFQSIREHLTEAGLFAFSTETAEDPNIDFHLQRNGRYQHGDHALERHIEQCGLSCLAKIALHGRYQKETLVNHTVFIVRKKA